LCYITGAAGDSGADAAPAALHTVAPPTAARRRNHWDIAVAQTNAALAAAAPPTVALLVAVHPAGVPTLMSGIQHPLSGANAGVGGRAQQACQGMGCKNHKVLECSYGLCGPCCAKVKRHPRCIVAKQNKRNTHH